MMPERSEKKRGGRGGRARERERQRQRQRDRETERDRQTETETERQRERDRNRETEITRSYLSKSAVWKSELKVILFYFIFYPFLLISYDSRRY